MTTQPQKRSYKLRPRDVNQDISPAQLPPDVYSNVQNMEAFDIGMRRVRGIESAYPGALFPPEHLAYNKDSNQFYWVYASGAGVGVTDGVAHFDITPAPAPTSVWPIPWTEAFLNTLICLNNTVDQPWFWDGQIGTPLQPLPGFPAGRTCNALRAFKNNLFALGTYGASGDLIDQLLWSQSAAPGDVPATWEPLPTNDAGDNVLADTIGALIDGQGFRDTFMLFKEHSTYLANFIGGNFVFNFRRLFTTSGILSQNCAAEYLGNVIVLTDGDFIRTDGIAAESLIDKRMRSFLFNNIDSDNYTVAFVVNYQAENQVWCCFPEVGETECTLALVWDGSDNSFGIRDLEPKTTHIARGQVGNVSAILDWDSDPEPWDLDTTNWNSALFNPTEDSLLQADRINSKTYAINEGNTFAGVAIAGRVEREGLDFDNPDFLKLVTSVTLRMSAPVGSVFTLRIGAANEETAPVQFSAPVQYVYGVDEPRISIITQGRFIAYSLESQSLTPSFVVHGLDFEYRIQGRF